jgi:hypothetical protein
MPESDPRGRFVKEIRYAGLTILMHFAAAMKSAIAIEWEK